MASATAYPKRRDDFLEPLHIDLDKTHELSKSFLANFGQLAAQSDTQFLATPISESILRPVGKGGSGR